MNKLKSILITTEEQVEIMRIIYNENLDMFTRQLTCNTYEQQQEWWKLNKDKLRAYLYEQIDNPGEFLAFLVFTDRNLFCTPTIAIKRAFWGQGFGKEIVNDYIQKTEKPMAGSQLKSNAAICHLNKKAGWQIIGEGDTENGKVDLLFHPGLNLVNNNIDEIMKAVWEYHNNN